VLSRLQSINSLWLWSRVKTKQLKCAETLSEKKKSIPSYSVLDFPIKKLHRSQKLSEGMLEFLLREEMVQVTELHQR